MKKVILLISTIAILASSIFSYAAGTQYGGKGKVISITPRTGGWMEVKLDKPSVSTTAGCTITDGRYAVFHDKTINSPHTIAGAEEAAVLLMASLMNSELTLDIYLNDTNCHGNRPIISAITVQN